MKLSAGIQKWGSAVLGLVAMLLVANLVAQYRSWQPGNSRAHAAALIEPPRNSEKSTAHAADDLAQYDPTIHFDELKDLDSRPLPDQPRDPFLFVGETAPAPAPAPKAAPAPPPAPPPPPPIKANGYNELPGGKGEAMITFNEDVMVVHEGDPIGDKYKVVKITPTNIVIEDVQTQKQTELSFPQ